MTRKEWLKRYFFVFILYLLGVVFLILFGNSRLVDTAENKIDWIERQLNSALYEMQNFYENNLEKQIKLDNCKHFLQQSKPLLLLSPYIRSVNLAHGGVIVCSSISGSIMSQYQNWEPSYTHVQLEYVENPPFSELFPADRKSILSLHFEKNNYYGVYVAIYPEMIFKIFGSNRNYISIVKFKNVTLKSDGSILIENNKLENGKLFDVSYKLDLISAVKYTLHNYGMLALIWTIMVLIGAKTMIGYMGTFSYSYWSIRVAIKRKHFEPYIQPVFNRLGEVTGGEVLVRWVHPKKGVIFPSEFIARVEENGQIIDITSQIMTKCRDAFTDVKMSPRDRCFRIGFNVCPIQFDDYQLMNDISDFQVAMKHKPIDIILELTERKEFESNEKYKSAIYGLRNRNILVALDDFGIGSCSLKYLHNAQIDMIKIDRMYVATIDGGEHTKLLDNIISLARSLDVPLLAEGVETQAQFEYLKKFNIERYQGFLFEHPMPLKEFIAKYIH